LSGTVSRLTSEIFDVSTLSKFYGSVHALDDVTFKMPSGAIGLLGPNGAGKTTLLRILLGLIKYNSGTAKVLGYDISTDIREIRDNVGYSPEFSPTMPDVTAMKYVTFMGALSGLDRIESAQRAHDTLHYVGLGEERYRPLSEFSTGMMQKCKLAAALVHDPDLIILDEPTDGLDPIGRQQMLELIEKLYKDEKKNILISSHLLFDVERICDEIIVLGRGKVIRTGALTEVLSDESNTLRIRITGDVQAFTKQLKDGGLDPVIEQSNIDIPRVDGMEMIILREINNNPDVSLQYMGRKTRSLEDVFIATVEGDAEL
jgi:ABC-2 type transport system ATP-binding protein